MFVRENRNGVLAATYLVGPRGPEYRRDDQTETIRWYCYDGLGSVLGEVAPDGTLTRTQSFDVCGSVRTSNGLATSKHKFVGALGHPSDDETGLIYMRARWMDPVTGRFISEDPAKDGNNWFDHCAGNPVNHLDPSGRESFIVMDMLTWLCDLMNRGVLTLSGAIALARLRATMARAMADAARAAGRTLLMRAEQTEASMLADMDPATRARLEELAGRLKEAGGMQMARSALLNLEAEAWDRVAALLETDPMR